MPKPADLAQLKEIFQDERLHMGCGLVTKTTPESDNSTVFVRVKLVPDNIEIVARMSWESVGGGGGIFQMPQVNDLVLVAFVEGSEDQAFVVRRLSSREDKVPATALSGDTIIKAILGKKIKLGKAGDSDPDEPMVLGLVLVDFLTQWIDAWLDAPNIGTHPLGPVFMAPTVRTALLAIKSEFLETTATDILSQVSFTERGD